MRSIELEYGKQDLRIRIPDSAVVLSLPEVKHLPDPHAAIEAALDQPLNSPPLATLARQRRQIIGPSCTAVIVVSDNTRPVPYQGSQSLLNPILEVLRREQISRIQILVAAGTHRKLSDAELKMFLPESLFDGSVEILQHDCRNPADLRQVGVTERGTEAWINRHYLDAHLKILTGLVEPHFMAGASGGAKSICPGVVGEKVTHVFHSAAMMADPACRSFNLIDNPCFQEARAVAARAGCDFILNGTINRDKQLAGLFAGELITAHNAACRKVLAESGLPITSEFDVVLTHAGFVGVNHYQAGKAAVEASRAVKRNGTLILFGRHTDPDPIGSGLYKKILVLLKELGPDGLDARLLSPDWTFVPEQWQPQMWGRVLRKLGPDGSLIYCSPHVTGPLFAAHQLPGRDGGTDVPASLDDRDWAEHMVQHAIDQIPASHSVVVLKDGPYGVPWVNS